ncbi:MMPL family transporter [Virgibacillus sp. LDC-1]|uniref:MMPL family transporter n=1 Tax=Virgibacillus sp. LDC-1 TaxID=3039856 RepID=UPI0024DE05AE|nr:MMPL family transporter [Virgibacillus sp. LDC-1]
MRMLARIVLKGYKYIILFWVLLAIAMAFLAIRLPSMLEGDGFRMDGEHEKVMDIAAETFDMPAESLFLVFDGVSDEKLSSRLQEVEALGVTSEIISPLEDQTMYKKDLSYALLHFNDDELDMAETVTAIRDVIKADNAITLTGQSAITKDINTASQQDLMTAEAIGLPIAIIVLLFAFGTVVASLVPLLIGVSSVVVSFGILAILGNYIDLSIFILNIIPMLGLALSIDFALLFISRYREERRKGNALDAVSITIQTAGRSVLFSAFCVFIGLGAMLLIQVEIFENIAVGGMIVVAMAVISSITLLPSVLIALGDRIDKWQLLKVKQNGSDRWRTFAGNVIKRPIMITIVALILLGIALIPVRNMDLTIPQIDSLPKSYDSRLAYEKMEDTFDFGGESSAYIVAYNKAGWEEKEGLEQIKQLEDKLTNDPLVKDVQTIYQVSGVDSPAAWEQAWGSPMKEKLAPVKEAFIQDEKMLIPVQLNVSGASDEAQDWVRELDKKYASFDLMVGGEAKFNQEIFDEIADKIIPVLTVIIISTFIVLMLAFRSILIPFKAIVMNVLGLSATFGILVYIFQYGHFGLTAGTIALIIPVIVFSLVFGLSMDYEVFLISRIQEAYANTQDNDFATVEGLAATSKIITSAALIMIVLTGAFAFTDVMPVKQIGVGIAIAVAIDATIIRLLLVPSLMKLFGKWNWWLPFRKGPYRAGSWH